MANTTIEAQLHVKVRDPARIVDIIPRLKQNFLLSISNFVEANYQTVFTPDEVQIFNGKKASITSSTKPILQGWKDKQLELWWLPIIPRPSKEPNTHQEKYAEGDHPKAANNVYKLPNSKQIICYHHAMAGFPTKASWIRAIKAFFYAT